MQVSVSFYSYFKDLTGCEQTQESLPEQSTLDDLMKRLLARFPKLASMQNSILIAVGVEYQDRSYIVREGDQISMFPPVQGG